MFSVQVEENPTNQTGKLVMRFIPQDNQANVTHLVDCFVGRKMAGNFIKVEDHFDVNSDYSPVIQILNENIIKGEYILALLNERADWNIFKI